jgi:dihydrofolate reductase
VAKLRVHNIAMSLDGYAAGPNQSIDNPLGAGGNKLHEWIFKTRTGNRMLGLDTGDEGLDDQFLVQGELGIGATIIGRNMFGPVRGSWTDEQWVGWWGDDPPYHHPVYVLTHHARASIPMKGGTIFHFVTDGIEAALDRALEAANGRDVRLGGGSATIQQYLRAGLIDEMHVAIVPVLLGSGERLFDNVDASAAYECVEFVSSPSVAHVRLARRAK